MTQARKKKKRRPTKIKEKNTSLPPLQRLKEEVQSFFGLRKDSKNLTIEKKVEGVVFMRGHDEGTELLYVALYDTKYLKRVLKMSGLDRKTKDLIKQALTKT